MISWLRTVDTVLTESICDFHQCAINIEVQQRDNVNDL